MWDRKQDFQARPGYRSRVRCEDMVNRTQYDGDKYPQWRPEQLYVSLSFRSKGPRRPVLTLYLVSNIVIKGFGYTTRQALILSTPGGAIASLTTLACGYYSDRKVSRIVPYYLQSRLLRSQLSERTHASHRFLPGSSNRRCCYAYRLEWIWKQRRASLWCAPSPTL